MVRALGQYRIEVTELPDQSGQLIIVDQFCIPENAGRLAKESPDRSFVGFHLFNEFPARVQKA
jgi:hypothetical protein